MASSGAHYNRPIFGSTGDEEEGTPNKPVLFGFRERSSRDASRIDGNGNVGQPPSSQSSWRAKLFTKRNICLISTVVLVLLLILVIALSASSSGSGDYIGLNEHNAQQTTNNSVILRGRFDGTVLPNVDGDFSESFESHMRVFITNDTHRLRRQITQDSTDSLASRIRNHLAETFDASLLQAVTTSALCQQYGCKSLKFDNIMLINNSVSGQFRVLLVVNSTKSMNVDRKLLNDFEQRPRESLATSFANVFSGYRLQTINITCDLKWLCLQPTVICVDLDDRLFPSAAASERPFDSPTTFDSANNPITTEYDRSQLLPDIVKVFTTTYSTSDGSTSSPGNSDIYANASASPTASVPVTGNTGVSKLLPPVSTCSKFGYMCRNQKDRIAMRQKCDGVVQCPDGSDEEFCHECVTSLSCTTDNGRKMCLRGHRICDQQRDCPNGFDESPGLFCNRTVCQLGEYRCKDSSICIPEKLKCDGDQHCPNGDDETACSRVSVCNNNARFCSADSKCIASWALCDGVRDCSDGSDEVNCSCIECSSAKAVLCSQPFGRCILKKQVCDGISDCPNDEDEINCPGWCQPEEPIEMLKCADNKTYPKRYACNGLIASCEKSCGLDCNEEVAFRCKTGGTCISKSKLCDGVVHCLDGSDESPDVCNCVSGVSYQCQSANKCINPKRVCDGFRDCPDGEDEENCDSCVNNINAFYCRPTRSCFPSSSRCDGYIDCSDYSDEDNCSCSACRSQWDYKTFMCKEKNRCLRREYVCNPSSKHHCPGEAPEDEQQFCSPNWDPLMFECFLRCVVVGENCMYRKEQ